MTEIERLGPISTPCKVHVNSTIIIACFFATYVQKAKRFQNTFAKKELHKIFYSFELSRRYLYQSIVPLHAYLHHQSRVFISNIDDLV